MALHAHGINADALRLEPPDQPAYGIALCGVGQRIVVVIQLCARVGLMGCTEGNLDEILANDAIERRLAERTVILYGLVNHIPAAHLALEVANHLLYVSPHAPYEHVAGYCPPGLVFEKPPRNLRMPHKAVACQRLVVVAGKSDKAVGRAKIKLALTGL